MGTTRACHIPQDLLFGMEGREGEADPTPQAPLRRGNPPASSPSPKERPTGHLLLLRDGEDFPKLPNQPHLPHRPEATSPTITVNIWV